MANDTSRPEPFFEHLDRPSRGGAPGPGAPATYGTSAVDGAELPQQPGTTASGWARAGTRPGHRSGHRAGPGLAHRTGSGLGHRTGSHPVTLTGTRPRAAPSRLAMGAVVCSVIGLVGSFVLLGLPVAIAGLVLGLVAWRRAHAAGRRPDTRTLAAVGIALVALCVGGYLAWLAFVTYGPQTREYMRCVTSSNTAAQRQACFDHMVSQIPPQGRP